MIELGKTYPDKSGNSVRIICVDRKNDASVVGLINETDIAAYSKEGNSFIGIHDLILPEDYSSYKIDEPVMVRDCASERWNPRYFAGVTHLQPCTWSCGATSWTNGTNTPAPWNQCRRPTKEELGEK